MQRTEAYPGRGPTTYPLNESTSSAVSWAAVFAGAVIGAALMATLVIGGAGLGLLAVSPWQNDGASGTTVAIGSVLWLFVTQIIAYGVAGYVTGRLRTKWTDTGSDEIYFRDTAHGFLVWALSFVVGLLIFGWTAASVVSGTAKAGAQVVSATAGQVASVGSSEDTMDYFAGALLRPADAGGVDGEGDARSDVAAILARSMAQGKISDSDERYLVQLISQRANLNEADARVRLNEISGQAKQAVEEVEVKAREAADAARKYAATFSLWAFASLLLGAFIASLAATMGGRARNL